MAISETTRAPEAQTGGNELPKSNLNPEGALESAHAVVDSGLVSMPELPEDDPFAENPLVLLAKVLSLREQDFKDSPELLAMLHEKADDFHYAVTVGPLLHASHQDRREAAMDFYRDTLAMYAGGKAPDAKKGTELSQEERIALIDRTSATLDTLATNLSQAIGYHDPSLESAVREEVLTWQRPLRFDGMQTPEAARDLLCGALKKAKVMIEERVPPAEYPQMELYKNLVAALQSYESFGADKGGGRTLESFTTALQTLSATMENQPSVAYAELFARTALSKREGGTPPQVLKQLEVLREKALAAAKQRIDAGDENYLAPLNDFYRQTMASEATQSFVDTVPKSQEMNETQVIRLKQAAHMALYEMQDALAVVGLDATTAQAAVQELESWHTYLDKPANESPPMLANMVIAAMRRARSLLPAPAPNSDAAACYKALDGITSQYTASSMPSSFQDALPFLRGLRETLAEFPGEANAREFRAEIGQEYVARVLDARLPWLPANLQENITDLSDYVLPTVVEGGGQSDTSIIVTLRNFHRATLAVEATGVPLDPSIMAQLTVNEKQNSEEYDSAHEAALGMYRAFGSAVEAYQGDPAVKQKIVGDLKDWNQYFYSGANKTPEAQFNIVAVIARRLVKETQADPTALSAVAKVANEYLDTYMKAGVDGIHNKFDSRELAFFVENLKNSVGESSKQVAQTSRDFI